MQMNISALQDAQATIKRLTAERDEAVALLRTAWERYDTAIRGGRPGTGLEWSRDTRAFLSRLDAAKVAR